jgi:amino acid transporter
LGHQSRGRGIGLLEAISIGVGGMIGAGIFSILGVAGQTAGTGVWISFIIAGIVALLCTYSFSRLSVTYPSAGGPVEFLVQGLGGGMLSGGLNLLLWIGYILGLALYARAFGGYASTFFSSNPSPLLVSGLGTGIIVLFAGVNLIGAKAVGRVELLIVMVKVAILLLFAASGLYFSSRSVLAPETWPSTPTILFGAGVVFLAYEGFGLITNAAEDMRDPVRTLPRALYLSVVFVMFVYVLVSLAVLGNLTVPEIVAAKDYALAAAAKPFLGNLGFRLIAVAALFSTSSAINAALYGGANVSYTIARDGELPTFFERKVWGRRSEGLVITTVLVIIFANLFGLNGIAMMGSASFLIIYGAVNMAHLRLLDRTGARASVIWASMIACLATFVILLRHMITNNPASVWTLGIVLVSCLVAEMLYRRATGRRLKARQPAGGTGEGLPDDQRGGGRQG